MIYIRYTIYDIYCKKYIMSKINLYKDKNNDENK